MRLLLGEEVPFPLAVADDLPLDSTPFPLSVKVPSVNLGSIAISPELSARFARTRPLR